MCAISWWITSATRCSSGWVARSGSTSSAVSRKVTQPRFSIAPNAKSGHRDQVELVGRVGEPEVVREEAERERARLEGEGGQGRLARRVRDAQRRAVHVDGLGGLQRPDDEGDEVGRHLHRLGEAHLDPSLTGGGAVDLGRVRQGREVVVDDQGDLEGGLRLRLVPAGERPPGVGGLELGGGDHVAGAGVVGERRPVEAVQLVVEDAPEGGVQGRADRRAAPRSARASPARCSRRRTPRRRGGGRRACSTQASSISSSMPLRTISRTGSATSSSTVSRPAKVNACRSGSRVTAYREGTTVRGRRYWSATGRSGGEGRKDARSFCARARIGLVAAGAGPRGGGPALAPPDVEPPVPGHLGDLEAPVADPVADAGRADAPAAGELGPAGGGVARAVVGVDQCTGRCRRPSRCRRRRRGRRSPERRRTRGRRWPAANRPGGGGWRRPTARAGRRSGAGGRGRAGR